MSDPKPLTISEWFHQETKYDRRTINLLPRPDFDGQPMPWKQWHSRHPVDLVPYLPFEDFPLGPAEDQEPLDSRSLGDEVRAISRTLFFTCGATGFQQTPEGTQIFRAAPSAGALYPTEVMLVLRDIEGLKDGLYAYSVPHHQLVLLYEGVEMEELAAACWDDPVFEEAKICVVLSGLWQRSRWRYHDRAYRRILLDTGHVLGNLVHAAGHEGFQAQVRSRFVDSRLQSLLFLNDEEEGVLALVPLVPWQSSAVQTRDENEPLIVRASAGDPLTTPPSEDAIVALHRAGELSGNPPAHPLPMGEDSAEEDVTLHPLQATMADLSGEFCSISVQRRSTRQFTGASIDAADMERVLDFSHRFMRAGSTQLLGAAPLLDVHCLSLRVKGIDSGHWHYCAENHHLALKKRGDHRRALQEFCLGQELAADAAAAVIYSAPLSAAVEVWGDRIYRDLHLDSGFLGHQINLACMRLKAGVSGIAGFFDDSLGEFLGLPEGHIVTYITLIGDPMPRE